MKVTYSFAYSTNLYLRCLPEWGSVLGSGRGDEEGVILDPSYHCSVWPELHQGQCRLRVGYRRGRGGAGRLARGDPVW